LSRERDWCETLPIGEDDDADDLAAADAAADAAYYASG
jgi:hypothetical protein